VRHELGQDSAGLDKWGLYGMSTASSKLSPLATPVRDYSDLAIPNGWESARSNQGREERSQYRPLDLGRATPLVSDSMLNSQYTAVSTVLGRSTPSYNSGTGARSSSLSFYRDMLDKLKTTGAEAEQRKAQLDRELQKKRDSQKLYKPSEEKVDYAAVLRKSIEQRRRSTESSLTSRFV